MAFHKSTRIILISMGLWKFGKLSKWKSCMYTIYSGLMMTLIFTFLLTLFFDLLFMDLNAGHITEHIFMSLLSIVVALKICNYLYCRSKMINIMRIIKQKPFRVENTEEDAICRQFGRKVR